MKHLTAAARRTVLLWSAGWLAVVAPPLATAATFLQGIDVSNYQGVINWTSVKNAGIVFAFCKATEGIDFVDAKFTTNMTNANSAGVYIGPYHFARPDSYNTNPLDAANEANDFVDAIQPYYAGRGTNYLRPVIDVEALPSSSWSTSQNKSFLSTWINNFAEVVVDRLGIEPIIYANSNYAINYLNSSVAQYDFWLANYNYTPPSVPPNSQSGVFGSWDIWQYSGSGSVSGISGAVDRDVYMGSTADFLAKFLVTKNADFNEDGDVDGDDLLVWQRGKGVGGNHAAGDANFDETVNASDLSYWTSGFGAAAATPALASVPEPSSSLLVLAASSAAWLVRRRS